MIPTRLNLLTPAELFYLLEDIGDRIASGRCDQQDYDLLAALRGEVALRALRS